MEDFYKQIEHSMGIHMLVKKAEDKLHVVTMKPTSETVDNYYQRTFKLWKQAGAIKREKVRKFEITLKLSISHALIGQKHIKIMDVLDAAREIEHRKSQISSKFSREAKTFQKPSGSLGRTWRRGGSAPQAGGSSSTETNSVAPTATSSSSRAPKSSGKPVNTSTSVNLNAKFIPTSTKLASWVGTWYNSESYPRKLQDDERATLLQEEKCWGCRWSGHRRSDVCCPSTSQKLNTTAQAVEEVSNFDMEKA